MRPIANILVALTGLVSYAQIIPVGAIDGTAFDSSRAVVPGVKIVLTNLETADKRSVETDEQGRYFLPQLRPGKYRIEAEKPGFQKNSLEVMVETGKKVTFDLDMAVGSATETVQVRAEGGASKPLRIHIEDDGPGIPAGERERSLRRGTRLDQLTPGQGLGLAVAADIVASYRGRLDIDDSPLGGAMVTLVLP